MFNKSFGNDWQSFKTGSGNSISTYCISGSNRGYLRVSSIKIAEAAKVIENTQRDLNIALMNKLALICDRLGITTENVLTTARTKWNFLPFTLGLVGPHCIGVDPYYLTTKAEELCYSVSHAYEVQDCSSLSIIKISNETLFN